MNPSSVQATYVKPAPNRLLGPASADEISPDVPVSDIVGATRLLSERAYTAAASLAVKLNGPHLADVTLPVQNPSSLRDQLINQNASMKKLAELLEQAEASL